MIRDRVGGKAKCGEANGDEVNGVARAKLCRAPARRLQLHRAAPALRAPPRCWLAPQGVAGAGPGRRGDTLSSQPAVDPAGQPTAQPATPLE